MTLKECIDLTVRKHPELNCNKILKSYFLVGKKSFGFGCFPSAFSSVVDGKYVRSEILKKEASGVLKEMQETVQSHHNTIEKLIDSYSNWYDNQEKSYDSNNYSISNTQGFDYVKKLMDHYKKSANLSYNDVKTVLIELYNTRPDIAYYINLGDDIIRKKGGMLGSDVESKVINFLSYLSEMDNLKENKSKTSFEYSTKKVDSIISMNISPNDKVELLCSLYNDTYNKYGTYVSNDIKKQDVRLALIRNLLLTSIVSTNTRDRSVDEYKLYRGLPTPMEEILYKVRKVISKLLNNGLESFDKDLNSETLINRINNLSSEDIEFLSYLYVALRDSKEKREVLDKSLSKAYNIDKFNQEMYKNTNKIISIMSSSEFINNLKNNKKSTIL